MKHQNSRADPCVGNCSDTDHATKWLDTEIAPHSSERVCHNKEQESLSRSTRGSEPQKPAQDNKEPSRVRGLFDELVDDDMAYFFCLEQDNMKSPVSDLSNSDPNSIEIALSREPRHIFDVQLKHQEEPAEDMEVVLQRMKFKESKRLAQQKAIL